MNFNLKIWIFLKLEDKKENIEIYLYKLNVFKEMNIICIIFFDSEFFDKVKKRFLVLEFFYLFYVYLKMNWLKDEMS